MSAKAKIVGVLEEQVVRMAHDGATDREIEHAIGVSHGTVYKWRKRRGAVFGVVAFPIWKGPRRKLNGYKQDLKGPALELHAEGISTTEIGARLQVNRRTVYRYLREEGLGSAYVPLKRTPKRKMQGLPPPSERAVWRSPLYARVARAIGTGYATDVLDEAISDLLLDVIAGDVPEDQIETVAPRYRSRAIGTWASTYGPVSLDETRGAGDHKWTYADFIADEAQESALRVVELTALAERMVRPCPRPTSNA